MAVESSDRPSVAEPRERFLAALDRRPLRGRVPHFELIFYPTMEAFGKVHFDHRDYSQWEQMTERERQLHREDCASLYIAIAERFEHSAIFLRPNPRTVEETIRLVDLIRNKTGYRFGLFRGGDATLGIPDGGQMMDFCCRLSDEPAAVKAEAERMVSIALARAEKLARHGGLDGFFLNTDYCFNDGPFISPSQFSEFVAPYLAKLIQGYRDMGFYTVKHTDGNIRPILDQLVQTRPHALHSLDPQGGVDIAKVKAAYGDQVCLIGNVNCTFLHRGSDADLCESVRYALRYGMPGGGYIFSTSNCVFIGAELNRYERMLEIWRTEGVYA
jgi:uroporphyrinogen decarboxylase